MSEAVLTVPRIVMRAHAEPLAERVNRIALVSTTWLESLLERRRERRLLEVMSDRDLSDIGIGRGQTGRAFREGRG